MREGLEAAPPRLAGPLVLCRFLEQLPALLLSIEAATRVLQRPRLVEGAERGSAALSELLLRLGALSLLLERICDLQLVRLVSLLSGRVALEPEASCRKALLVLVVRQ